MSRHVIFTAEASGKDSNRGEVAKPVDSRTPHEAKFSRAKRKRERLMKAAEFFVLKSQRSTIEVLKLRADSQQKGVKGLLPKRGRMEALREVG